MLIHSAGKNRVCTVLIHVICKIFPLPHQQEFHFLSQQRSLERNVFFTTLPKSFIYFCNLFVWKSVCTFSLTFMAEFSHRFGNVRNKNIVLTFVIFIFHLSFVPVSPRTFTFNDQNVLCVFYETNLVVYACDEDFSRTLCCSLYSKHTSLCLENLEIGI